jgi:hypothetical protein
MGTPISTPLPSSSTKKITRFQLPRPAQHRRRQPQRRRRQGQRRADAGNVAQAVLQQADRGQRQHQREPDGHRRGPHRIRPAEGGCFDEGLVVHVVQRRHQQQRQQQQRRQRGENLRPVSPAPGQPHRDGGQPHVLAGPQRQHRAEHRQPEEHDRRKLVAPHQRMVQAEAADHPDQQDGDLGQHRHRREGADDARNPAFDQLHDRMWRRRDGAACRSRRRDHVSGPVVASSSDQALSPNFARQSL